MHRCHFQKNLSAYFDNQLDEKQKLEISNHLKECKVCAQELARLEMLSGKLKNWQVPNALPGFDAAVTEKIVSWGLGKGEVKMKRKTLGILIPSGVLAGILVFLFVGVGRHVPTGMPSARNAAEVYNSSRQVNPYYGGLSVGITRDLSSSYLSDNIKSVYSTQTLGFSSNDARSGEVIETFTDKDFRINEGQVIVIEPGLPATGEGEKVIRVAVVTLEVEDGKRAYKQVVDLCQELGGFLASSNFYRDDQGRQAGKVTLRIPKDKFSSCLDRLGAIGRTQGMSTDSKDVSQDYANLNARLEAEMVVYKKMLEALQKKQATISDAVRLESELTPVIKRVQELKNQIEALNNQIAFTTITVNFFETPASFKALKESGRFIREGLLTAGINTVQFIAKIIPLLLGLVVVLAVVAVLGVWIKNWINRSSKNE